MAVLGLVTQTSGSSSPANPCRKGGVTSVHVESSTDGVAFAPVALDQSNCFLPGYESTKPDAKSLCHFAAPVTARYFRVYPLTSAGEDDQPVPCMR